MPLLETKSQHLPRVQLTVSPTFLVFEKFGRHDEVRHLSFMSLFNDPHECKNCSRFRLPLKCEILDTPQGVRCPQLETKLKEMGYIFSSASVRIFHVSWIVRRSLESQPGRRVLVPPCVSTAACQDISFADAVQGMRSTRCKIFSHPRRPLDELK